MIDLSHLGALQSDGSIMLDNTNIKFREKMSGDYKRFRPTPKQKDTLAQWGFRWVKSSFISGIGVFGSDLRIRFHNGSVYEYYGFADSFDGIMRANSKGQYFNRNIRPTKQYAKIGNLDFPSGNTSKISDTELFDKLEAEYITNIVRQLSGVLLTVSEELIRGVSYYKYSVDGTVFYRPVISQ